MASFFSPSYHLAGLAKLKLAHNKFSSKIPAEFFPTYFLRLLNNRAVRKLAALLSFFIRVPQKASTVGNLKRLIKNPVSRCWCLSGQISLIRGLS